MNTTPVLLLNFNRPHLTRQLVNQLRLIKPLFIMASIDGPRSENEKDNNLCNQVFDELSKIDCLFTPKSAAFLKWRYEDNPLQDYVIYSSNDWYIAFYVKKHRFFNELRVVETVSSNPKKCRKQMQNVILRFAFKNKCGLITTSNKDLFGCKIYGKFGPKLTIRTLTKDSFFTNSVYTIKKWCYSLGDLELF